MTEVLVLAAREHGNRTDPRLVDAPAVAGERAGRVGAGATIAGLVQYKVEETRAPASLHRSRIGADIFARFSNKRRPRDRPPMQPAASRLRLITPCCIEPLACMSQLRSALLIGTRGFNFARIRTRSNI